MIAPTNVVRRRVRVIGRVQGVGYRESCRAEAIRLGVTGSVRNLGDGSVEAVFEGDERLVDLMVSWCRRGPRLAHVRTVEVGAEEPTGASDFRIAFG